MEAGRLRVIDATALVDWTRTEELTVPDCLVLTGTVCVVYTGLSATACIFFSPASVFRT